MDKDAVIRHHTQHLGEVIGVERIDLKEERALSRQGLGGILGDGAIEKQRVIVRYEERQMRLVIQHVAFHRRLLFLADIRGIAHDEVVMRGKR
jgi:hypothetical protein